VSASLLTFAAFLLKTGPCEDADILSSVDVKSHWRGGKRWKGLNLPPRASKALHSIGTNERSLNWLKAPYFVGVMVLFRKA
jgi:hypothetical protein